MTASCVQLAGGRWHFSHGPMDIVLKVEGAPQAVQATLDTMWRCFEPLLGELVQELDLLRKPIERGVDPFLTPLKSLTSRRMYQACYPFCKEFITPMAAVAGAVAQELITCSQREGISRAWVNNGGDIALHLAPGHAVKVGLFADLGRVGVAQLPHGLALDGQFEVTAAMPVRGIATSGWRGRSLSLGIADSVTVLAATAAQADAAATMIANAVNVQHDSIVRMPANQCRDDSDLANRLVTVQVPPLPAAVVATALTHGLAAAQKMQAAGLIFAAALVCQGQIRQTQIFSASFVPLTTKSEALAEAMPLVLA